VGAITWEEKVGAKVGTYMDSMGRRCGRGMTVTGPTVVGDGGVFLLSFVRPLGFFSCCCGGSAIGTIGPPIAISTALGAEHYTHREKDNVSREFVAHV
jgi:hypothetical protein